MKLFELTTNAFEGFGINVLELAGMKILGLFGLNLLLINWSKLALFS